MVDLLAQRFPKVHIRTACRANLLGTVRRRIHVSYTRFVERGHAERMWPRGFRENEKDPIALQHEMPSATFWSKSR